MRRALVFLLLLSLPGVSESSESLVMVKARSPWTLRDLQSMGFDLVSYDPDTGEIYLTVDREDERRLFDAGFDASTIRWNLESRWQSLLETPNLGLYHTLQETVAELESLAAAVPELTALEVIGHSLEGRPIYALKISDDPGFDDPDEPDVLIVGNHHARELMSVEVPLFFARTLLERAQSSARVRQLVNERELWIVPLLNPDGHVFQEETQDRPGWRKNRRVLDGEVVGVDLNRNYSYRWGYDEEGSSSEPFSQTYRGDAPFSEPETRALRSLVERQHFSLAISYHSFGGLVLYPWGYTRQTTTPDQGLFATLADSMVRGNGYRPGNAWSGTIYLTNGVWDDYMYAELGGAKTTQTFPFTVELNTAQEGGFWPPDSLIEPTCESMLELNLFVLRMAGNVASTLPPPVPILSARQDPEEPQRIDLSWRVPADGAHRVVAYEVFEIDPTGSDSVWSKSRPVRLQGSGRAVLARASPVPDDGMLRLITEAQLEPLWDHASVEVRAVGETTWHVLERSAASGAAGGADRSRLTGRWLQRRMAWNARAWRGQPVDVALHLEPYGDSPQPAWIQAKANVPDMLYESRRVVAVVQDTSYTVWSGKSGLLAYGVTAVDAQEMRSDSEIFWFYIPPSVPITLEDLRFSQVERQARLSAHHATRGKARYEAWCRPLKAGETPGSAEAEWGSGSYRPAASLEVDGVTDWFLQWDLTAQRTAVLLRSDDGGDSGTWGPWIASMASPLRLEPATPNPFNPSTRLRFAIATPGPVVLEILRPDGKRMRTLRHEVLAAGVYEATWDGRDQAGIPAASGVYLARLLASSRSLTTRLVLLR